MPLNSKGTKVDFDLLACHQEHIFAAVMREGRDKLKKNMFRKRLHNRDPSIADTGGRDEWNEEKETAGANGQHIVDDELWFHVVIGRNIASEIEKRSMEAPRRPY